MLSRMNVTLVRRLRGAAPVSSLGLAPTAPLSGTDGYRPPNQHYTTTTMLSKRIRPEDMPGWDYFPHGETQIMNSDMTVEEAHAMLEEELKKLEEEEAEAEKSRQAWKPGERRRPLKLSYNLEDFEHAYNPDVPRRWTTRDKRCGALAIKVGMISYWDDWGEMHPVTLLFVDSNVVLQHKTMEKHGYVAVQLGAGERKMKNVSRMVIGQYKNVVDYSPYLLREFRVTDEANLPPIGSRIHARHFVPGQAIDIAGIAKGKGFQGGMKRWGFAGMPASHGVSLSHRAIGATGACQDPGKVWKGKKMPGRMGGKRRTVQNSRIMKIDRGRNLLYVKGHVPGNKGAFVEIKDAVRRPFWNTDKVLGSLDRPPLPTFEYDAQIDGTGLKGYEEKMPQPDIDPLLPVELELHPRPSRIA